MNALDELLSATGAVDEITPDALRRGRLSLAAVSSATDAGGVRAARWPARHGLRRTLALTGVAAAACAAVITIPVLAGAGAPGAEASAATLLRTAGSAAGAQPGGWPDAAYWHVTSLYQRNGKTYDREIWISHHGQSVLRDAGLGDGVISLGPGLFAAGGTALTWDQLYALPTDPGQLGVELRADIKGAGPSPDAELFTIVGDLLRESPAPPALRKALYDVAADIPGVHLTGKVTDALGRTGTGVERDGKTLVIDPRDGALLAESELGFGASYVNEGPATSAPAVSQGQTATAPPSVGQGQIAQAS